MICIIFSKVPSVLGGTCFGNKRVMVECIFAVDTFV